MNNDFYVFQLIPLKSMQYHYHLKLKDFPNEMRLQELPIWLSIGPSLTMSFSTLSISFLTVYRYFLNGREIIEILPSLIFPMGMLLSTLVWMPIQRVYTKKQRQRLNHDQLEQYRHYIHLEIDKLEEYKKEMKETIHMFPLPIQMEDYLKQKKIKQYKDIPPLPIGISKNGLDITIEKSPFKDDHSILSPIYEYLKQEDEIPLLISFQKERKVNILHATKDYIVYVLLYYCFLLSDIEYSLCIYTNMEWLDALPWIKEIPHLFIEDKRALCLNEDEFISFYEQMQRKKKLFILNLFGDTNIEVRNEDILLHFSDETKANYSYYYDFKEGKRIDFIDQKEDYFIPIETYAI